MDPDLDPGNPKTCGSGGSGSATLQKYFYIITENALGVKFSRNKITLKIKQINS
jgi:hypothetical protein